GDIAFAVAGTARQLSATSSAAILARVIVPLSGLPSLSSADGVSCRARAERAALQQQAMPPIRPSRDLADQVQQMWFPRSPACRGRLGSRGNIQGPADRTLLPRCAAPQTPGLA